MASSKLRSPPVAAGGDKGQQRRRDNGVDASTAPGATGYEPPQLLRFGPALIESGFDIVPLVRGQKYPLLPEWQSRYEESRATVADLEGWAKADWTGVGILGRTTPGVDLDILDPDAAEAMRSFVVRLLGARRWRVGLAPKVIIPCRALKPFRKVTSAWLLDAEGRRNRVEVMGDGQQWVCSATHPETKRPYVWYADGKVIGECLDLSRDELPDIDEARAREIVAEFEGLAELLGWRRESPSTTSGAVAPREVDALDAAIKADKLEALTLAQRATLIGDLQSALAVVPSDDRELWVRFGHALKELDEDGWNLWRDWSEKSDKYDAEDAERVWASCKGVRTGFAAVFKAAQALGWVNPAAARAAGQREGMNDAIEFINFATLADQSAPPRRWIVPDWLPRGTVTLLAGAGGVGKSLLAQQLAIAVANGLPFLGLPTEATPVIGLFCEDDRDELLRRAERIFAANGIDPVPGSADLHLDARAGKRNLLMSFIERVGTPTELISSLRASCALKRPGLVVIDNVAQVFAGGESDRSEATQFCNELTSIAHEFDCAVLLLGHPAKAEGSQYSGSTAWEAAVRTRLFLERKDDGSLTLHRAKANYAALGEIAIEYHPSAHVLMPVTTEHPSALLAAAKNAVLEALGTFTRRHQSCSNSMNARSNLPRMMVSSGLARGLSVKALQQAVDALVESGEVVPDAQLPWRTGSRHRASGLVLRREDPSEDASDDQEAE